MQAIADLREPPTIGRFYLVPVVPYFPWHQRCRDWPVLGPLHTDADFFRFPHRHYHVDVRFLTEHDFKFMARHVNRSHRSGDPARDAQLAASSSPISDFSRWLPRGRPQLQPRRCRRQTVPTPLLSAVPLVAGEFEATYGPVPKAIAKPDGRRLCPHRKLDLSQFAPDVDGLTTCPLHGLRVDCR